MNVVMVGPFGLRPRGTMSVRALPMAQALAARGHTVTVLLPPWQNPEDSGRRWEEGGTSQYKGMPDRPRLSPDGVGVGAVGSGTSIENIPLPPPIPGLFHLLTALRLARRTLALRPDVVHLFKPKAYSGLAHWLLARLPRARRPRLVVDTDDWEGPGGWNDLAPYSPAQKRFFTWQERWGLTHADAVTVASRTLESLVWGMGVEPKRVFYVPNGIAETEHATRNTKHATHNTKHEARREEPGAEEDQSRILHPAPCILLYTRFFEFPVSRVIEVLQRVRERVPAARLLVVGEGLFGEQEELLHLATQSGLTVTHHVSRFTFHAPRLTSHVSRFTPDVTYAGWPVDLPTCFAQSTLAIYPFDDTLVNRTKCAVKLLELLAAGVPVVAEAVGQNREMIRHGETGWLVEPGDVAAFAQAVARLLEDAPLRERLGQAAARDVQERLAWKQLVERVETAYDIAS